MANKDTIHEAHLIIQSSGKNGVRDASQDASWSKLFKADNYFVDLSYETRFSGNELIGNIIRKPIKKLPYGGYVKLMNGEHEITRFDIDSSGIFILDVEKKGYYELLIVMQRCTLRIPSILLGT